MDPVALVWGLLLGAPIAALLLQTLAQQLSPRPCAATAATIAAFLGVVVAAGLVGIRFVPVMANVWTLAAAYVAYGFLVFSAGRLPWPKAARYAAIVVGVLPIIYGYFFGTVGLLALMFVAGEYVDPPKETVQLNQNVTCIMTEGGGLDSAYNLRLHQEWPLAPLLHRQIKVVSVGENRPSQMLADCAELRDLPL